MSREQKLYVFSVIRTIGSIVTSLVNLYILWKVVHHL